MTRGQLDLTPVGTRRHHVTGEEHPVVALPRPVDWDEIVLLEGQPTYFYVDATGEECLCKRLLALDAGDNVVRRVTAPAQRQGIGATYGVGRSVSVVPDEIVAWVD